MQLCELPDGSAEYHVELINVIVGNRTDFGILLHCCALDLGNGLRRAFFMLSKRHIVAWVGAVLFLLAVSAVPVGC